jgi:hypothetical protein
LNTSLGYRGKYHASKALWQKNKCQKNHLSIEALWPIHHPQKIPEDFEHEQIDHSLRQEVDKK